MEKKKLCSDAKEAIKEETNKVLDNKLHEFEANVIDNVSKNLKKYLLDNSEKIIEKSKKNYKLKVRNSVAVILDGYFELKEFVNNTEQVKYKRNYKLPKIIRSDEFIR